MKELEREATPPAIQDMSTIQLKRTLSLVLRKPVRRAGIQKCIEEELEKELHRRVA